MAWGGRQIRQIGGRSRPARRRRDIRSESDGVVRGGHKQSRAIDVAPPHG